MSILVVGEHNKKNIADSTKCTIKAASHLNMDIDLLLFGQANDVLEEARKLNYVNKIVLIENLELDDELVEPIERAILPLLGKYSHIFLSSTSFGKNLAPRIAAKLDVAQISDITRVIDPMTYERFVYAGNIIQIIQSSDSKLVVTVRASAFDLSGLTGDLVLVKFIERINFDYEGRLYKYSRLIGKFISQKEGRPELGSAKIIISGGAGLGSQENFNKIIHPLAKVLNAAVGATRSAVDAGYISNDFQIGQTGKIVSPLLYIAIGISGAPQHLAGIKDSKIIVAINKDKDAPIFNYADYAIVGDLFEVVPEFLNSLINFSD